MSVSCGVIVAVVSATGQGVPETPAAPPGKAAEIGTVDAESTGRLPALTSELAQRGAAAISRRQWKEAREIFRELLETEPDNPLALSNLGSVEYQLKDFDAAVTHLEAALKHRPNLAQTWLTLGMVHYQRDDFYRALSAVSRAVAEKPDDARAHNHLAAVNKALGWTTAAEAELQKALDLDPGYAEAHFNLALMYLERKPATVEMARRHYLQALELGAPGDELVEKQLKEFAGEETLKADNTEIADVAAAPTPPTGDKAPPTRSAPRTQEKPKSKGTRRRD